MTTAALGIVALLGWVGLEFRFRRPGAASSLDGGASDRGSTALLIASYGLAIVLPPLLAIWGIGAAGPWAWLGLVVAAAGLALRAWAMATLGASYTRTLRATEGQSLVTHGPYRVLRHPGYAASCLVWIGATLAFGRWPAAVVVGVLLILAYSWRIRAEETMLEATFGQAYRDYAARTWRLVPRVY